MRITIAHCQSPRQVKEYEIELPEGSRVGQALQACGLELQNAGQGPSPIGIWGRRCTLTTPLHEGDRLEVYRPLRVDPKVARRERFKGQGARTAGLFARRRPGAKPGY